MTPSQVIVLAIPVFLLLIGAELALSVARGKRVYRLNDTLSSMSLGVLSQLSGLFTAALYIGIYSAVYDAVALVPNPAFWLSTPRLMLLSVSFRR